MTRITRSDAVDVDEVPCSSNMTMEAWAAMNAELGHSPEECIRTRMIGELSRMMRDPEMPEDTRTAGLTLIGWLARRMPGEAPHALGAPREGATRASRATSDVGPRGKAVAVTSVAERRTGKR